MTLDTETIDALLSGSPWPVQVWAESVRERKRGVAKMARDVENHRVRFATDTVYRERIRRDKRECEQRRRDARKAKAS